MVLRLRLSWRTQETVEQAYGSIDNFEDYLNSHPGYIFQQQETTRIGGRKVEHRPSTVLLCGEIKVVLAPPKIVSDGKGGLSYYNRVITVRSPNRGDRADALAGREVTERIEVEPDMPDLPEVSVRLPEAPATTITTTKATVERVPETAVIEEKEGEVGEKPAKPVPVEDADRQKFLIAPLCPKCQGRLVPERGLFCQNCGARLPDELAVHKELVVAIRPADYQKLAEHLRQKLNIAWSQLVKSREVKEKSSLGQKIFLITVKDEIQTSTLVQEKRLDELLAETGIGRLSFDPYELREAREMITPGQQKPTQ